MKEMAVMLFLAGLLIGCQTVNINISVEPPDARIYVNDELKGTGSVSIPAGYEYGCAREMKIDIRHPDYQPFEKVIKTRLDFTWVAIAFGMNLGIDGHNVYWLFGQNQFGYGGNANLALAPVVFFNFYGYEKISWHFVLEKK